MDMQLFAACMAANAVTFVILLVAQILASKALQREQQARLKALLEQQKDKGK